MTLISALISKRGVAVATDSLLTIVRKNAPNIYVEWKKSKIIPIPKLNACISYWGFAGVLKGIPKDGDDVVFGWQTHEWLSKQSANSSNLSLEEFTKKLRDNLEHEMKSLPGNIPGIGLHITGIEKVGDYRIPELFLVTNFKDPTYQETKELTCSRETFHTISGQPPADAHGQQDYRMKVNEFLNTQGFLIYNNGDPTLFNPFANSFFSSLNIAQQRGKAKNIETVEDTVPIVRFPIEAVSQIQQKFYDPTKKIIGGRVHDLSINDNGIMKSTSGDV